MIFIIIINPPEKKIVYMFHIIQSFSLCVKKNRSTLFYKIPQIKTDTNIPITSPASAASKIPLVFFIFTELV